MRPSHLHPPKLEMLENPSPNTLSPSSPGQNTPNLDLRDLRKSARPSRFVEVVEETMTHVKLEEIEPQKEYNFEVHGKQLLFAKSSLGLLSDQNRFRKALVWFLESKMFAIGITIIIFLNTVFLALGDYEIRIDPKKESPRNDIVTTADMVFSAIFILEFILKVLAMGFVNGKGTYLRNGWNVVDFIVVITSVIYIIPSIPNVDALRPVRAIKPLRTITTIKGVKSLVSLLIDSLPALANVSIFLLFLIIVYSILGIQLFSGAFENRCRLTPEPVDGVWLVDPTNPELCGTLSCPEGTYCGSPATYDLPKNWSEIQNPGLVYGIPNFDNMLNATLTVFQSLTTEGWSTNMYMLSHVYSPPIVIFYFCSLIVLGAFFAVNLILAVINDSFDKSAQNKETKSFHSGTTIRAKSIANKSTNEPDEMQTPSRFPQALPQILPPSTRSEDKPADENGALLPEPTFQGTVLHSIQQFKSVHLKVAKKSGFSTDRTEKPLEDKTEEKIEHKEEDKNDSPESIPVFKIDEHINQRTRYNKFYYYMHKMVLSKIFLNTVILLIVLNTVILGLYKYPDDRNYTETLETINIVLTFIFIAEMILKLIGLGFVEYSKDRFNLFDAFIVIISLVEFITDTVLGNTSAITLITAFRCFRLVRVFKLARSWTSLRNLLAVLARTLKDIKNFTVLVLVFVAIAALLGLELFAYRGKEDDGQFPRMNFNTFPEALVTVFALMTGENWNGIMYSYFRKVSQASAIYFVLVVLVGNYILLKLFLAILINNFQGLKMTSIKSSDWGAVIAILKMKRRRSTKINPDVKPSPKPRKSRKLSSVAPILAEIGTPRDSSFANTPTQTPRKLNLDFLDSPRSAITRKPTSGSDNGTKKVETPTKKNEPTTPTAAEKNLEGRALFILSPENIFRRVVAKISLHWLFENFVLVTIICSSIILALDSPTEDPSTNFSQVLSIFDKTTTFIFAVEMISKIITYGVIINGPQSYLKNPWNVLDCFVVIISLISLGFDLSGGNKNVSILNQLKILRTLRVLRPLRLISRNEGLKLVLNSILAAIPSLINLIFVCMIFFLLFGVVGVNFFKGQFYYCDLSNIPLDFQSKIVSKLDCMDYGGDWVNQDANFDNVLQAVLTLFQLATTEGWLDIMYTGLDSVGIDRQPIKNASHAWAVFFVLFIIVGSFFVLNLFAGVVVDTFNREKDRIGGISFLTKSQQAWIHMKLAIVNLTPYKHAKLPQNEFSTKLRNITDKKSFEIFSMAMIFLNMIIFALHWDRQDEELSLALDVINYVLLAFFTLEAIAKIIGHGTSYFSSGWNLFDLIIIIISIVTLIIDKAASLGDISLGSSTSVIRTFRVGRVFRLINKAKSLRTIFNTIIITLPALANIGGLLLLVLFIYASLGNSLFAYLKMGDTLNSDINFQTFGQSFLTLFKISTGENWNSLFYICSKNQQPNYACTQIETFADFQIHGFNDCGSGSLAVFYFISFQIIFTFIMLNLFIAVILEAFNESNENESAAITDKEYEHFKAVFKKYDVKGRGLISETNLEFLLQDLEPPLLNPLWKVSSKERTKFIIQAKLSVYELPNSKLKFYQFHDIMLSLSRRVVQQTQSIIDLDNLSHNILQLKQIERVRGKHTQKIPNLVLHPQSSSEIKAASILTAWAKKKYAQRKSKSTMPRGSFKKVSLMNQAKEEMSYDDAPLTQDRLLNYDSTLNIPDSPDVHLRALSKRNFKHTILVQESPQRSKEDFETVQLNIPARRSPKQTIMLQGDSIKDLHKPDHKAPRSDFHNPTFIFKEGFGQELEKLEANTPINRMPRKNLTVRKGLAQDLETLHLDNKEGSFPLQSIRIEKSADSEAKTLKNLNFEDLGSVMNIDLDVSPAARRGTHSSRRLTSTKRVPKK